MTTTNGPHVTNLAQHLSIRQEFPEEHIQCDCRVQSSRSTLREMSLLDPARWWTSLRPGET